MKVQTNPTAQACAFAEAFRALGVTAYAGPRWDGASGYKDPTFWYPRDNGGVGAYVTYGGGTYDMGFLEPEDLDAILERVRALGASPSRVELWAALEGR